MNRVGGQAPILAALKVTDFDSGYGFWVDEIPELDYRDKYRYVAFTFNDGVNRVNVYAPKSMEMGVEAAKFIARRHKNKPFKSRCYKGCRAKYAHTVEWDEPILVDLNALA